MKSIMKNYWDTLPDIVRVLIFSFDPTFHLLFRRVCEDIHMSFPFKRTKLDLGYSVYNFKNNNHKLIIPRYYDTNLKQICGYYIRNIYYDEPDCEIINGVAFRIEDGDYYRLN